MTRLRAYLLSGFEKARANTQSPQYRLEYDGHAPAERHTGVIGKANQLHALAALEQQVIARAEVIDQSQFQRPLSQPVLACGDLIDVEAGAIARNVIAEQAMDFLQRLAKVRSPLVGVFTKDR